MKPLRIWNNQSFPFSEKRKDQKLLADVYSPTYHLSSVSKKFEASSHTSFPITASMFSFKSTRCYYIHHSLIPYQKRTSIFAYSLHVIRKGIWCTWSQNKVELFDGTCFVYLLIQISLWYQIILTGLPQRYAERSLLLYIMIPLLQAINSLLFWAPMRQWYFILEIFYCPKLSLKIQKFNNE